VTRPFNRLVQNLRELLLARSCTTLCLLLTHVKACEGRRVSDGIRCKPPAKPRCQDTPMQTPDVQWCMTVPSPDRMSQPPDTFLSSSQPIGSRHSLQRTPSTNTCRTCTFIANIQHSIWYWPIWTDNKYRPTCYFAHLHLLPVIYITLSISRLQIFCSQCVW